jgi:hypothetical protein
MPGEQLSMCLFGDKRFEKSRRVMRAVDEGDAWHGRGTACFGAEFVDFDAPRPGATAAQRHASADSFLVPTRTLHPRTVRPGLRLES